jgi:hypothetical protein
MGSYRASSGRANSGRMRLTYSTGRTFPHHKRKLQVPPLRFAPVGMTRGGLRCLGDSRCLGNAIALPLSSRPERSAVEGPAVSVCGEETFLGERKTDRHANRIVVRCWS